MDRRLPRPSTSLHVDRTLPVSIHQQLVGQIEYGVSSGRWAPGVALPSVRDLAEQLDLSPVTVSHAFKSLRERGIIETFPGRGTFVAQTRRDDPVDVRSRARLRRAVDDLMRLADNLAVPREDVVAMATLRAHVDDRPSAVVDVTLVGVFPEATAAYARAVAARLGGRVNVRSVTFHDLDTDDRSVDALNDTDLILTFPHRRGELERALGKVHLSPRPALGTVRLLPSPEVRTRLAGLSPFTRIGLVTAFPSFLPTFLDGVRAYARHVSHVRATVLDADDVRDVVGESDVVVYATGADRVLHHVPPSVDAFEYRHVPDPTWTDEEVVPLVETLRFQRTLASHEATAASDAPKPSS